MSDKIAAGASIAAMEILVVEDEAGIADFLERGLEAEGYGVDGRGRRRSPASGWRSDPGHRPRVLDRMLPGRDGIEVLAAIRRVEAGAAGDPADRARPRSPTGSRGSTSAPPTT